jgi:hypothetical protein
MTIHIEELVKKAAVADKSEDAMRFSQAACNAANAWAMLEHTKRENQKEGAQAGRSQE